MERKIVVVCLVPAALCLLICGCAKKASTIGRQAQHEEPQLASDVSVRVRDIQEKVNALAVDAAALPGEGPTHREADAAHRRLMQQCFTDLTQVLPLIEGAY